MNGRGRPLTLALTVGAVAIGVASALQKSWLSDDAFISFRYARHLVNGLGLVYNAGERVEGYSNFLWTIWAALGMRLGIGPEAWCNAWGIACYAGAIALLGLHRARVEAAGGNRRAAAFAIPLAALGAALHPDWARFATSGLETSLFTLLLVLGWMLLARAPLTPRAAAGAGFALALAALTRPEGVMFGALGAAYVVWQGRPRWAALLAFAALFLAAWAPYVMWKIAYYGDYLPNTYYAKSAALAWWSQGAYYAQLFFMRSIVLVPALPLAAIAAFAAWRASRGSEAAEAAADPRGPIALAAAFALGLTLFVMRVGGDFMFARLLVPAIPFYFLMLEYGLAYFAAGRAWAPAALSAAALALLVFVPYPMNEKTMLKGIVHEWAFYPKSSVDEAKHEGAVLARYFAGLPVRVAFVGGQAMLMYYADPPVAIESQAGLTDAWIAHQPLKKRGRIGHEKIATLAYLLEVRHVNLVFKHYAGVALSLDDSLPTIPINFEDVPGRIVCWDDSLFAEFRKRGVQFIDFRAAIEQFLPQLPEVSDSEAAGMADGMRRFWFERTPDPELRARVVAALQKSHPAAVALLGP